MTLVKMQFLGLHMNFSHDTETNTKPLSLQILKTAYSYLKYFSF